ncbi:Uncharacterised protein [Escherichia coli]|nr:Uncharacterised protein [Escherichia coli]
MKPLKDEEAADGISRKQSQNAVYQTCATLAGGEALAAANAACLHSKLLQNPTIKVVYNIFF